MQLAKQSVQSPVCSQSTVSAAGLSPWFSLHIKVEIVIYT